ncbi:MAG: sigma-70 family RNA polymerase sigma factor [Bacteroidota bacterium]
MLKIRQGDVEKLDLLYRRYSRRLFGFFFRMTNEGATSEDLVQNVFVRILKYKHTYKDDGDFEVWIFQLARNVFKDHYRKNKRYAFRESMEPYEQNLGVVSNKQQELERQEELENLKNALDKLSEEKRELITLVRYEKMKYSAVAQIFGVSESAIKVRVHRIIKELRACYLGMDAESDLMSKSLKKE